MSGKTTEILRDDDGRPRVWASTVTVKLKPGHSLFDLIFGAVVRQHGIGAVPKAFRAPFFAWYDRPLALLVTGYAVWHALRSRA